MSKWPSPPGSCTRTSDIACSHLKSAPAPQKLLRRSLSILLCFLPTPHSTNLWFWQFHLFLNPSSFYPASFHSLTLQELPAWTFYLWNLCSLPFPNPSLVQLSQWLFLLFNNYIKLIGSIHSALVSLFLVWFYFSLSLETFQVYKKLKEWIFKYPTPDLPIGNMLPYFLSPHFLPPSLHTHTHTHTHAHTHSSSALNTSSCIS